MYIVLLNDSFYADVSLLSFEATTLKISYLSHRSRSWLRLAINFLKIHGQNHAGSNSSESSNLKGMFLSLLLFSLPWSFLLSCSLILMAGISGSGLILLSSITSLWLILKSGLFVCFGLNTNTAAFCSFAWWKIYCCSTLMLVLSFNPPTQHSCLKLPAHCFLVALFQLRFTESVPKGISGGNQFSMVLVHNVPS